MEVVERIVHRPESARIFSERRRVGQHQSRGEGAWPVSARSQPVPFATRAHLGQPLLVRCRAGITITEAGSILATRGLARLREAGAIREELANDPAGRVVVGMPAALRHLVTLPALQKMRSTSPGTAVRVHEGFNVFLR